MEAIGRRTGLDAARAIVRMRRRDEATAEIVARLECIVSGDCDEWEVVWNDTDVEGVDNGCRSHGYSEGSRACVCQ